MVAKCGHLSRLKFAKALPHAFTEHGAIMAASVLHSRRAVEVAAFVVRAFVKVRRVLSDDRELAHKSASRLESFDISENGCLSVHLPTRGIRRNCSVFMSSRSRDSERLSETAKQACRRPRRARASGRCCVTSYRVVGTLAFSSSNQFWMRLMWVTTGRGGGVVMRIP